MPKGKKEKAIDHKHHMKLQRENIIVNSGNTISF